MKTNETSCSMFIVQCCVLDVILFPRSILHSLSSILALLLLLLLSFANVGLAQPVITEQPQSCTNVAGTTATFWVSATGTEPLAYQWQKLSPSWTDLPGCTDTNLVLRNVQSVPTAGDYRVVITNFEGAVTSDVARLTVLVPPAIFWPVSSLQSTGVTVGKSLVFRVTATGTGPLSYQWRRDGADLADQTKAVFTIAAAQPEDESEYTVVITNVAGAITSAPVWLYVSPLLTEANRSNYIHSSGDRLPFFFLLPTNYVSSQRYPLFCYFHGAGDNETNFLERYSDFRAAPQSYKRQITDPMIVVWPTRREGDWSWLPYVDLIPEWLDWLNSQFSIDTNRVYIGGGSAGEYASWVVMGMRPWYFAAAIQGAGGSYTNPASTIKDVPTWFSCGGKDTGSLPATRAAVGALRQAGGNPIYTEYQSGDHLGGIVMPSYTPAVLDWLLAQRRGQAVVTGPLLSIASPAQSPEYFTGATTLDLAGSAGALGETITCVSWTNCANNATGIAAGTNAWSITDIPLVANTTNLVVVVATTTSWCPAFGGNTTFNDTLTVIQSPLRASLTLQGTNAVLNWTGGGSPYRVQRATDLAIGDWVDVLTDAVPPVSLPTEGQAGFYRVVGQ